MRKVEEAVQAFYTAGSIGKKYQDKIQGGISKFFVRVEVCYVAQYVADFKEGSMWHREESIFFCVCMECSVDVS